MKILYVLQNRNFFGEDHNRIGGHIAHIIGVVEAFQHLGHQVIIASFDRVPFWNNYQTEYFFLKKENIKIPGLSGLVSHWNMSSSLIEIIENQAPDLIYLRMSSNIFFYRVRKRFSGIPLILECNSCLISGMGYSKFRKILLKREDKYYLKVASIVSVVSENLKKYIIEKYGFINSGKLLVNPNGVDVTRFHPVSSVGIRKKLGLTGDVPVVGFSGNFAPWHRIDILIQAIQRYPDKIILLLIGTGSKQVLTELKKIAQKKNNERIIFTGTVPFNHMPEYLAACDILALPQDEIDNHRSPIKLFEYMAMQKPIIASAVGQIAKVLQHEENGLLFENNVQSIVDVIKLLVRNKELSKRIALNARNDVERNYSWEANVKRILKKLDELKSF